MRQAFFVSVLSVAILAAACSPPASERADEPHADEPTVWIIGDSIAVAASKELAQAIPGVVIDAATGRQFRQGPAVLEEMLTLGKVPDILVVALGTNGPIDDGHVDEIVAHAGEARIVFVNVSVPRDWERQVNDALLGARQRHGVTIVDWKTIAVANQSLLRSDGYHPSADGIGAWAHGYCRCLGRMNVGAGYRSRTGGLSITSRMLYQLS